MKRLLLSGIGGSIGIHTFGHIMYHTDWHVVGIDSFRHKGWTDRIAEDLKNHPERRERLTVVTHDLTAPFSPLLIKKIGPIDYIINMASMSDVFDSIHHSVPFVKNNIDLALNMLEYAKEVKPRAFIQISTDEVYGPSEAGQEFEEWSPILPSNPYSASKACQESLAIAYWRTYNVPIVIVNAVNNFGEMQSATKFPVIVQNKVANGEKVIIHGSKKDAGSRYYLHSRNFADALLFILKNLPPYLHIPGKVDRPDRYNIASDERIDNLQFAKTIASVMGKPLEYEFQDSATTRPGHDRHYGLSGKKLRDLGWKPPMSFEESLKNVIIWQQEHKEWIN